MGQIKFRRLKKKDWFLENQKPIKIKEDHLIFKIIYSSKPFLEVGFVVSKKVSKKAVERNKIKRRLREILRERSKKFKQGGKILIFPLPGIDSSFHHLKKTVEKIISKTNFE